jgi:hypothetical protein
MSASSNSFLALGSELSPLPVRCVYFQPDLTHSIVLLGCDYESSIMYCDYVLRRKVYDTGLQGPKLWNFIRSG